MFHGAAAPEPSFWHPGAAMQAVGVPPGQQQQPAGVHVRRVWAANLQAETATLGAFAARARYVAFAVHYPGVIVVVPGNHNTLTAEQRYAGIKANVDVLKPLQVGLAVGTYDGRCLAWEFNVTGFNRAVDPHAPASVHYLEGRGMHLDAHRLHGVPVPSLAAALRHSGLLGRPGLTWVVYAGAFHAAYLMKVVRGGQPLPADLETFLGVMELIFRGDVYDVARMAGDCPSIPVGLERVAARLRFAPPLGSPWLTGASAVRALQAFMRLAPPLFGLNGVHRYRYRGLLQGLQVT